MIKNSVKAIALIIGIVAGIKTYSQNGAFKQGERIPDTEFKTAWNYTDTAIRLSDFKDKLIVLDFWTPRCISCLESFPYMDSLQKAFDKDVQIILVNHISADSTDRFFQRFKKVFKPSLPMITNDTLLRQWFPHEGVPFHVIIDKDRTLLSAAEPMHTTPDNIAKMIKGEDAGIIKGPKRIYTETLFDERWKDVIYAYSYLSKWKEGLNPEGGRKEGFQTISFGRASVAELYQYAWDGITNNQYRFLKTQGRTQLEVKEPYYYTRPTNNIRQWKEKYQYNYQLRIPENSRGNKYEYMKNDLDRYFGLQTSIEKRNVECFALTRIPGADKLKSKGGPVINTWDDGGIRSTKKETFTQICNQPFSFLTFKLKALVEFKERKPFIDLTNYHDNIDIEFNDAELGSFEKLRGMLNRYGLDIETRHLFLDVLVIKETAVKN